MRGWCALAMALSLAVVASAQAPTFTPRDERLEDLPPGPGREETFGMCSACHAFRLVSNQGMTRGQWDDTLTFMTERHNMPALEGKDREVILDYLEAHYPSRSQGRGGWRNPFAPP